MIFIYGFLVGVILTSILFIGIYKVLAKSFESKVQATTQSSISASLLPLKEKMLEYQSSITKIHEYDIEQNAVMKTQLQHMMEQTQKMELETKDLTQALKGDVKAQGDWGEFILERALEISGMEKGREFVLQGTGLGLKDDDGNSFRPDAIVYLPGNAHIVIDSKVSLKSLQNQDYKELKKNLTAHIDGLSKKAYQKLDGLNSPDFVIMFVPLEAIMPIIFKEFPEILEYAAKKNIVLSTPISILPVLKTIFSIWRLEKQNKNSQEIAKKAGLLYDKFVLLYEDLQKSGELIQKLSDSHSSTMNKLAEGKGNIHGKVEELRELGAKVSKSL